MNPNFNFAFNEFGGLESQIQFFASMESVSAGFNYAYFKWTINGLGEAYGFWFKLKSNQEPFIVKTLVNTEALDRSQSIEWLIDAKNIDTALQVFEGLKLDSSTITWKKGHA
jgi:hypothetical protein